MSGVTIASFLFCIFIAFPASRVHDGVQLKQNIPDTAIVIQPLQDTLVNYCKLVRAAYFYGQKFADKKLGLSAQDVDHFNELWKGVFNIPSYQTGITNTEFIVGARFGEGNRTPFPPAQAYHKENHDPYLIFHIAKEMGMIHSQYFSRCTTCVELSTAKINAYLKSSYLHTQISVMWPGTHTLKRVSVAEIPDFWILLRCMFIDAQTNPTQKPKYLYFKPTITCPAETIIKSSEDIRPDVTVDWVHCEIGGAIDTIGPMIIQGTDNLPGAVYEMKFIARDQCHRMDSCIQRFVIK